MHVVHLAAEASPYAKTGGLGDVLGALPAASARGGIETMVVLPGYREARRVAGATRKVATVSALVSSHTETASVLAIDDAAVPTRPVDAPQYFDRPELYGEDGHDYPDNAERFVFFCRAALAWLATWERPPDVLQVHDWQAALAPAFLAAGRALYPALAATRTVTTVHNL